MGLGGPVWHASAASQTGWHTANQLEVAARAALAGVGDVTRGEWVEVTRIVNVRRRLSIEEEAMVGPVVDVRGTPEAERRVGLLGRRVRALIPPEILAEELGVT